MFELHPHQAKINREVMRHRSEGADSCLIQSATGSGKTILAMDLLRRALAHDQPAVFMAARRELISQPAEKLETMMGMRWGHEFGIMMAGEMRTRAPIQIVSKDTLVSWMKKHDGLDLPEAKLVIVDEAHGSLAPTWIKIIDEYIKRGAYVVGLTATPDRSDGRGLGEIYDHMVQGPSVQWLIDNGYLVPGSYFGTRSVPDLASVTIRKGDYAPGELEETVNTKVIVADVVQTWLRLASDRRTVVFAAGIKHSIHLAEQFQASGINAAHISGKTPSGERDAIISRFRSGKIQVLCNCEVLTMGFDSPETDCVVMARPTKSKVVFLQMAGRGLRTAEGKDDCLFLDHAGNVAQNGFPEDPVAWSLDGIMAEDAASTSEAKEAQPITCQECQTIFKVEDRGGAKCPNCGWVPADRGRNVNVIEGELEALRRTKREALAKKKAHECYGLSREEFYRQIVHQLEASNSMRKEGKRKPQFKLLNHAAVIFRDKIGDYPDDRWRDLPPIPVSAMVKGFIHHKNIRYAKRRRG